MFHEVRRLSSFFNFPAHVPIDPVKLAKCGFYYKNFRDSVECFRFVPFIQLLLNAHYILPSSLCRNANLVWCIWEY